MICDFISVRFFTRNKHAELGNMQSFETLSLKLAEVKCAFKHEDPDPDTMADSSIIEVRVWGYINYILEVYNHCF